MGSDLSVIWDATLSMFTAFLELLPKIVVGVVVLAIFVVI